MPCMLCKWSFVKSQSTSLNKTATQFSIFTLTIKLERPINFVRPCFRNPVGCSSDKNHRLVWRLTDWVSKHGATKRIGRLALIVTAPLGVYHCGLSSVCAEDLFLLRPILCILPTHRQQCNDTTQILLLSFWRKNFASTIFAGRSLWLGALFFLPLFIRNFFFQSAHLRDASSQALLTIHHKKLPSSCAQTSGHDSSLHDELAHWLPVISSPNFVFGQLRRQNAPLQTAMDKMHTMDSLLWATDTAKSKKNSSQN